jgi:hypothetical protein
MQPFLNLALGLDEWSALRRGRFTKSETALHTQYLVDWVSLRACLDA